MYVWLYVEYTIYWEFQNYGTRIEIGRWNFGNVFGQISIGVLEGGGGELKTYNKFENASLILLDHSVYN